MRRPRLIILMVLLAIAIVHNPAFVFGVSSNSTVPYYPLVFIDKTKYVVDQYVRVFGIILDPNGLVKNGKVTIQVKQINDSSLPQNFTQIARTYSINGSYTYNNIIADKVGRFVG